MTTCATCGKPIVQRYDGTFWKPPNPQPMAWFHDLGVGSIVRWSRSCGWAKPATSAPATASEGATECDGSGRCPASLHTHGCYADVDGSACDDPEDHPAAGVTSSDGDRGLSDEELDALFHWLHGGAAGGIQSLWAMVERILAARKAQPEGVERVEWGVRGAEDNVFAVSENREWTERWLADPAVLIRRTVTEYAPVVDPWEVVGDE